MIFSTVGRRDFAGVCQRKLSGFNHKLYTGFSFGEISPRHPRRIKPLQEGIKVYDKRYKRFAINANYR
jgi:hypothetical protein